MRIWVRYRPEVDLSIGGAAPGALACGVLLCCHFAFALLSFPAKHMFLQSCTKFVQDNERRLQPEG